MKPTGGIGPSRGLLDASGLTLSARLESGAIVTILRSGSNAINISDLRKWTAPKDKETIKRSVICSVAFPDIRR